MAFPEKQSFSPGVVSKHSPSMWSDLGRQVAETEIHIAGGDVVRLQKQATLFEGDKGKIVLAQLAKSRGSNPSYHEAGYALSALDSTVAEFSALSPEAQQGRLQEIRDRRLSKREENDLK